MSLTSIPYYSKIKKAKAEQEKKALMDKLENEKLEKERLLRLSPLERMKAQLSLILRKELKISKSSERTSIDIFWKKEGERISAEANFVALESTYYGIDEFALIESSLKIAKKISKNEHLQDLSSLKIVAYASGKNKYGKEALDYAASITLIPSDLRKIEWSNMDIMFFRKYLVSSGYLWMNQNY